jgi:hypothetical protein
MNFTVTELHNPVTDWKEKYFTRLTPGHEKEQSAYFIQLAPPAAGTLSPRTMFIQTPEQMFDREASGLTPGILRPEDVLVRKERQTFMRLELSGAICFAVHTSMTRLIQLSDEECFGLAMEVRAWPEDVAAYRSVDIWGDVVLRYCDDRTRGMQFQGE